MRVFFPKKKKKKADVSFYRQKCEKGGFQDNEAGKGRVGEAWMTACDATLVTLQEDRGVCTASLALSLLMAAVCARRHAYVHTGRHSGRSPQRVAADDALCVDKRPQQQRR